MARRQGPRAVRRSSPDEWERLLSTRVLIVEDDLHAAGAIEDILSRQGFESRHAGSVADARQTFAAFRPDLVVLDLMLPGASGKVYCRELAVRFDVGIIVASSISTAAERISLLEIGADDYIVKPFEPYELVARLRAVLRRKTGRPPPLPTSAAMRGRTFDPAARRIVHADGRIVPLTQSQSEVLRYLIANAGRIVPREDILAVARMRQHGGSADRSVDRVISRLRQKVEDDPRSPEHILSVYGSGYTFSPARLPSTSSDADEA